MTILVGNTIVNVAASTVAALYVSRYLPQEGFQTGGSIIIMIVVVTLIILIFSEVSPKVFAVKQATPFALTVSLPLTIAVYLLTPFSFIFGKIASGFSSLFGLRKEAPFVNEEEFKTLIEVGEEKGTLDSTEREMIHSIFEFRETTVKEIMIPRMDMVCLEKDTPIEEVLSIVKEKGHSRIPVYDESIDNIAGTLFVKDLLPYMKEKKQVPPLLDLVRKPYFVPESKMIDELLREFQKERVHMAIVVDEYGGTAGLITLEDVLEEIVGEIRDEFDKEKPLLRKVDEHSWLVEAKINIEELNETLNMDIPTEEDYESLGGFIFSLIGRIPQDKEEIQYRDLILIVEKVHGQRIKRVRIVRKDRSREESD
jgi:CBS domain containing-hemolysin-like protein